MGMKLTAIVALAVVLVLGTGGSSHAEQTALDRYVAAPDPSYAFHVVSSHDNGDYKTHVIEMTSQTFLSEKEVDKPVWKHWLTISCAGPRHRLYGAAVHQRRQQRPAGAAIGGSGHGDRRDDHAFGRRRPSRHPQRAAGLRRRRPQAHGGRDHRLYLGQVPQDRRRALAGPAAHDQGRRPRHGHRADVLPERCRREGEDRHLRRRRRHPSAAGRPGAPPPWTSGSSPSCRS